MKVYIICTCLAIWAFDLALRSKEHSVLVHAQSWNISKTFTPFEFEWTHRGSFNMSYCSRQLVNCYDIFSLEEVCGYYQQRDSICGAMVNHCHDLYGDDIDYPNGRLEISDLSCVSFWNTFGSEYWT